MNVAIAYQGLYRITLVVLGCSLFFSLFRAIKGPLIADRIVAVNMAGTQATIIIAVLTLVLEEGYLADVALIYTMLSFLAVVLLTKVYLGVYRERHVREKNAGERHVQKQNAWERHEKGHNVGVRQVREQNAGEQHPGNRFGLEQEGRHA